MCCTHEDIPNHLDLKRIEMESKNGKIDRMKRKLNCGKLPKWFIELYTVALTIDLLGNRELEQFPLIV